MTDPKLLPLPLHTEAGEFAFDAHVFEHMDMESYARDNIEHHTGALREQREFQAALIETLRMEIEGHRIAIQQLYDRSERLAEALKRARESIEEWAYFANSCGGEIVGLQEELSEIDLILRDHSKEAS